MSTSTTLAPRTAASQEAANRYFEVEATSLGAETYLTYPHCNIWGRDKKSFVFGRRPAPGEAGAQLCWKAGIGGVETPIPILARKNPQQLSYYEVATATNSLALVENDAVWTMEEGGTQWQRLYSAPDGATIQNLLSFSQDGTRLICGQVMDGATRYACVEIQVPSGESKILFEQTWRANHFHFCPFDENFIGFSHEEWPDYKAGLPTKDDRAWVWHAQHAPSGKFLMGGVQPSGQHLVVGHERWGFHDASALVVAYRASQGDPKGIHEIYADGREPHLIKEFSHFLHVDGSRDGKWIVADTTGPFDAAEAPIAGDEGSRSDVVLIERATGQMRLLARAHLTAHPYHVHPMFSPDAKWIFYNDSSSPLEGGAPGVIALRVDGK